MSTITTLLCPDCGAPRRLAATSTRPVTIRCFQCGFTFDKKSLAARLRKRCGTCALFQRPYVRSWKGHCKKTGHFVDTRDNSGDLNLCWIKRVSMCL